MKYYNKNTAALIIVVCLICIFIGLFLPKNNDNTRLLHNHCLNSNETISVSSPFKTAFKGEKISVIKLDGIINDSASSSIFKDLTSSNSALELIIKASKDPSVKGIIIRINSPGGTVAASQELYKAVINARKKKPVVITMGDIAASGGYYISAAADKIYANPGTLTGSIGVITSYLNFSDLLTKIGVKGVVIKSGAYKDIGNPTRPMTEEERKILQKLLDDTYDQFLTDVSKGRNIPKDKLAKIAQGLIYTGKQAKKVGLVDYLGDYSQAIEYTQKLIKSRSPHLARKYKNSDIPIEETWKGGSVFDLLIGAIESNINPNVIDKKLLKNYSYSKYQPLWLLE